MNEGRREEEGGGEHLAAHQQPWTVPAAVEFPVALHFGLSRRDTGTDLARAAACAVAAAGTLAQGHAGSVPVRAESPVESSARQTLEVAGVTGAFAASHRSSAVGRRGA